MMRPDCYSGQGNDIGLGYLSPGQQTTLGPLTATGKGFLITPRTARHTV
jgi:hypothetical protein